MKRFSYKQLAAVCLSICLAASQSMISVPVYAGQAAEGDAVAGENASGAAEEVSSADEDNSGGAGIATPGSAGHVETHDKEAVDGSESQEDTPDTGEMDGNLLLEDKGAAQVTGWQWVDPAHHLADGVLTLPDVNPDNQASFDDVVSKLPKKILATVAKTATGSEADTATGSNAKAGRQKELTLDFWSCDTFQTDRDGDWPTTGEYTFEAHLRDGGEYELSDAAAPLEVKVALGMGNLLGNQANAGDFTVAGGREGADYSYSDHVLSILSSTPMTISMKEGGSQPTADRIKAAKDVQADLTLAGVNIKTTGKNHQSPLDLSGAGESRIALKEGTVNTLDGSATTDFGPGIYVPKVKLTITGTGTLTAKGGGAWPGIGRDNDGNILIESGTVEAVGGSNAAGIGGSSWCNGGTITITGGRVTATGSSKGADIGNGLHSGGSVITISGGTVTTTGDHGIGDGDEGRGSTFSTGPQGNAVIVTKNISDKSGQANWSGVIFEGNKGQVYGNPTVAADFNIPVGSNLTIGSNHTLMVNGVFTNYGTLSIHGTLTGSGSLDNQGTAIKTSNAELSLACQGNDVMLSDTGAFTVNGGENGKDYSYDDDTLTVLKDTPLTIKSALTSDKIVVADNVQADITLAGVNIATNDKNCPLSLKSAGESRITLKEGTANTLDGSATTDFGPGIYVPKAKLTITGTGTLTAKGGDAWPGIGRDNDGNILIESGTVEAVGGSNAAGIGGSSWCNGGTITITGGKLTATGGSQGSDIGNGYNSGGSVITISGGTVTATGEHGIGDGGSGKGSTFSTGPSGNAVIVTKNITDKSRQNEWSGMIFEGDGGQVYGNLTATASFDIPAGKKLTIGIGRTLTVNAPAVITNNGTLAIYGTLAGSGRLDNLGSAVKSPVAVFSLELTGNTMETTGTGDFTVTGGRNGVDYLYDDHILTILTGASLEISGTSTSDRIVVAANVMANLTLAGVSITTQGERSPLNMDQAWESVITLKEGTANTLDGSQAGNYGAGIYVPNGKQLTITGAGTLTAKGGSSWPGIGRNNDGNILIESGTVEAVGGSNAAGIGGSSRCNGGTITITGGRVTTTGDHGIGDGNEGRGSTFSTGSSGNAVIVTKNITDKSRQSEWSGIIFEGDGGTGVWKSHHHCLL